MGRGGYRPGAGRKPKPKGVVLGLDGNRRAAKMSSALPPPVTPTERVGLLEPPEELSGPAKACWRTWAPHAIEERTLTPATEAGFRELCIRMANVHELDARIVQLGTASQEALPYLRERRGQAAQLNVSLKDFKLSAFGKPATAETAPPAKGGSEWAAFGPQVAR